MKLPNQLTLFRIVLSPVFIVFFSLGSAWSLMVCILIAALFEISDFLDGMLARKYEQVTDFGKLMDPFADSISRFTIYLCFLGAGLAPIWMIAVFFYRDVLVSVIRVFSIKSGVVVSARRSGKIKAWIQAISIFTVLFVLVFNHLNYFQTLLTPKSSSFIIQGAITLAMLVTLWSALDYWNGNKTMVIKALHTKS